MKYFKNFSFLVLTLTCLISCTTQSKIEQKKQEVKPVIQQQTISAEEYEKMTLPPAPDKSVFEECAKKGGSMERGGLWGGYGCVISYADAGKVCQDAKDCQSGACVAHPNGEAITLNSDKTKSITGVCKSTNSPYGCYTYIENGKLTDGICVD